MEKKKWMGTPPEKCDVCRGRFDDVFVDGKTTMWPWALMCFMCYKRVGVRGLAQKYNTATLEKLGDI